MACVVIVSHVFRQLCHLAVLAANTFTGLWVVIMPVRSHMCDYVHRAIKAAGTDNSAEE
jgi:hypothetical protein